MRRPHFKAGPRRRTLLAAVSLVTVAVHVAPAGTAVFAWAAHEAFHLWEDLFHEHGAHAEPHGEDVAPSYVHRHGADEDLHAHNRAVDLALRALEHHDGADSASAPQPDQRIDKHVPPTPQVGELIIDQGTTSPSDQGLLPSAGFPAPPTPPPRG